MNTIFKYELRMGQTRLNLPHGSKILTVQMQHNIPQLWAMIDTDKPSEQRLISIFGTGHIMPEDPGEYIATFQMDGGALVFHVFDGTGKM